MPADKYRFISPGVFITEVDQSQVPTLGSNDDGPIIIGRAAKGPAFRPTRVETWNDFVNIFGDTVAGGAGGDAWRLGNFSTPMYGTYAAKAYLANNSPVTYVRLLGAQDTNASQTSPAAGAAGWGIDGLDSTAEVGAVGLFVFPSGGFDANVTGTLGAIFYCTGTVPVLSGTLKDGTGLTLCNATIINQVATGPTFKTKISGTVGSNKAVVKGFSWTTGNPNFIRKVFNTNPVKTNVYTTVSSNREEYWLGETFEKSVNALSGSAHQAVILGLITGSVQGGDFRGYSTSDGGPTTSQTGWFISQDLNSPESTFNPVYDTTDLFKFHGLTQNGAETQNRIKISISDIRIPTAQEQSVDPYPTFTVEIRHLKDTDLRPVVYETFSNCNLNVNSQNYIGRKIGDKYEVYDATTQRLVEYGDYNNMSKHIRVEVNTQIAAGAENPAMAPFGSKGPLRFRSFHITGSQPLKGTIAGSGYNSFVTGGAFWGVDPLAEGYVRMGGSQTGSNIYIEFPAISLIATGSGPGSVMGFNKSRDAYFGVNLLEAGSNNRFDDSTLDLLRPKPLSVSSFVPGVGTVHQYVFTLDDIFISGSDGTSGATGDANQSTPACYYSGSRAQNISYTAMSGAGALVNTMKINKFTTVMHGGFDGWDIQEGDPLRNSILVGATNGTTLLGTTDVTSYARATINRALNIIADTETTSYDLAALPGITVPALTDKLIEKCEERGDALAIVDVENDYQPVHEGSPDSYPILPNVTNAVASMRSRTTDSSYGCCFFPWVQTRDVPTGQMLWIPPSVAALGTLGSSAASSELWFAPAGFNRGGLSKGAGGVAVTNVRTKLTSQQRDDLYDVRVNPIASFPTEGIVVFGQKTLQIQRSALDRINVRRLMIFLKKKISQIASTILFDQNVETTWARFRGRAEPLLMDVQIRFGLEEFRLILDETTTTPDLRDRNIMYAKVFLKPAKAIEFIAIDFFITSSGASFED